MRTIPITVNDEYIKGAGAVVGAAGSHSDVILDITFGTRGTACQNRSYGAIRSITIRYGHSCQRSIWSKGRRTNTGCRSRQNRKNLPVK